MNIENNSVSEISPQKIANSVFLDANETKSFSHAPQSKIVLVLLPLLLLFILFLQPFNINEMPVEGVIVMSVFIAGGIVCFIWLILKAMKPAVILSRKGMSYNPFGRKVFIGWGQVDGLVFDETDSLAAKFDEKLKIVFKTENDSMAELIISIKQFAKGNELFSLLKKIIPQHSSKELADRLSGLKPLSSVTMKYKNIELTAQGIKVSSSNNIITWDNIVSLKTADYVIAGYGAVAVEYASGSSKQILQIQSSTNENYQECIRFLITYAKKAAIDPSLIKILNYPINAAKADFITVFLICSGFILTIAGLIILSFYAPTVPSTWIYPLIMIPLSILPFLWTIKLLIGRFSGASINPYTKICTALFYNCGTICSVAILFAFSPASFTWVVADACALTNHLEVAETYYKQAEHDLSGNSNFLFTLGQFYFKKKDWNNAARYYILSYEKDPTNWFAEALKQIPRSLLSAGRSQEAVEWCDKILKRYSDRNDVKRVIAELKEEAHSKNTEQQQ